MQCPILNVVNLSLRTLLYCQEILDSQVKLGVWYWLNVSVNDTTKNHPFSVTADFLSSTIHYVVHLSFAQLHSFFTSHTPFHPLYLYGNQKLHLYLLEL